MNKLMLLMQWLGMIKEENEDRKLLSKSLKKKKVGYI